MALAIALPIAAVGGAWLRWLARPGWTVDEVERQIRADLPPGSDRKAVEAWFDRRSIGHVFTDDLADSPGFSGVDRGPAGPKDGDVASIVSGAIVDPEAKVSYFFDGEIIITFYLNRDGRCIGHKINSFTYEL
ncbi:MAG TPA: hypothetical protein VG406_25150 [Isosphaeraceae bacterium]|nr:hypothetical protein [Isosphaeraceae bacterium]